MEFFSRKVFETGNSGEGTNPKLAVTGHVLPRPSSSRPPSRRVNPWAYEQSTEKIYSNAFARSETQTGTDAKCANINNSRGVVFTCSVIVVSRVKTCRRVACTNRGHPYCRQRTGQKRKRRRKQYICVRVCV